MKKILKKILRYLHPLNRINVSFAFYDRERVAVFARRPSGEGKTPVPWSFDHFGAEIKELIVKGKQATTGRLQVIGLEELEKHFGKKWLKVVDGVHVIVQMTLQKNLSKNDAYAQVKDNAYIILFSNISEDEAKRRCKAIRDEIHKIFMKEAKLARAQVSVKADVSTMDPVVLKHEVADQAQMANFALKGKPALEEVMLPNVRGEPYQEPDTFDLSGEGSLPKDLAVSFLPLVDAQTGMVTYFSCVPVHKAKEGYAILAGQKNNKLYSELDRVTLEAFQKEAGKKPKTPFICPVHFNSVGDATNNSFLLQVCPKLTAEQKQQLIFELTDIPAKLNESAIKALIDKLKPFCKALSIRSDIYGFKKKAAGLGVSFLSMDIRNSGVPEATIAGPLGKFIAQAKENKLKAIICGLGKIDMLKAAQGAGFSMIGGEVVHPLVTDVSAVIKITLPE